MKSALHRLPSLLLAAALLGLAGPANAQEKSVRPDINKDFQDPDLAKFLGIFEGESREQVTHRKEIIAACKPRPGMAVADVGAGTGLFTRLLAQEVGSEGRVYAVDIARKFLDHIEKTSREVGLKNVVGILSTQDSVKLPPGSVDLVFICDTYHHFEFPFKTMRSISGNLFRRGY